MTRREALKLAAAAVAAAAQQVAHCAKPQTAGNIAPQGGKELAQLGRTDLCTKVALIQELYSEVAFSDSGIMYSMMRLDDSGIRPFTAKDLQGYLSLDATVGKLKLEGPQDYLHGENSISVSGLYLAGQSWRYRVTRSRNACREARRAFRSMDLIFRMGEEAGKPGWMGKPYGFRPSEQTSGDQYLHACFGLYSYHAIAGPAERRRIEQMWIAFADSWKKADYVLTYFGSSWDLKGETDSYNAILVMINALAWRFSKEPKYLAEARNLMERATWTRDTRIGGLRKLALAQVKEKGRAEVIPYSAAFPLARDLLKPGECLCWETTVHSQFVIVATEIISQTAPELLSAKPADIAEMWWSEWKYGIGTDYLPYYWFAVDLVNDTWRPLPRTPMRPKDQWLFGDPFCGCISQVRWGDPLGRFMVCAPIVCRLTGNRDHPARRIGREMMQSIDATRLHWLADTDGSQLPPEIRYYGQCLSSEVPGSFLSGYWMMRSLDANDKSRV